MAEPQAKKAKNDVPAAVQDAEMKEEADVVVVNGESSHEAKSETPPAAAAVVQDTEMKQDDNAVVKPEEKPAAAAQKTETAPLADDDPNKWDHSNRRVMVYNILKYIKNKDIPKMAKKWFATMEDPTSIVLTKWKKPPNATWTLVTCETEDMAIRLIKHITENHITNQKGKELVAVKAESNEKKRDRDIQEQQDERPKGPLTEEQVRDKLTPLWRLSYEEQMTEKVKTMIKKCAKRICQDTKKKFQHLAKEARKNKHVTVIKPYVWLDKQRAIDVLPVIASPQQHAYRNKCEFTFGYRHIKDENDDDKQIPSTGFLASGWSGGVSLPHVCTNVPWEACAVAEIVENFLQTSALPPYDSKAHKGMWRCLTIRTSRRTKECMVIVQHCPASGGAAETNEEYARVFQSEKERLVKMLTEKELPMVERGETMVPESHFPLRVTSIFFQEYEGLSTPPPEHPVQHAHGKKCLTEKLGECEFQISPGAFFQVNTEGAEVLYQVVVDKIKELSPSDSILLDVCCGTGSIGMTCMKQGAVSQVIGVDIAEPAIADANENAKVNGLEEKCRFIASKAEDVMAKETNGLKNSSTSVVAVVDPAREGLHPNVVRSIRMTEKIQRLVYVSCNPTGSLINDAAILCGPPTKRFKGRAFRPTFAQPVDMFPLSNHCEMVMVFDRMTEEDETGKPVETEHAKMEEAKANEDENGKLAEKEPEKTEEVKAENPSQSDDKTQVENKEQPEPSTGETSEANAKDESEK